MSAGLDWNEDLSYTDPKNDEIVMDGSPDPVRYVLGRPIVAAPGATWRYSGGTTEVLGAILLRATKQSLTDYARSVLFSPLGITAFEWIGSARGSISGFGPAAQAAGSRQVRLALLARWRVEPAASCAARLDPRVNAAATYIPRPGGTRIRVPVVAHLLFHALGHRRGADSRRERHATRLRVACTANCRDRRQRAVQRPLHQSAGTPVARLHPARAAAGSGVHLSIMNTLRSIGRPAAALTRSRVIQRADRLTDICIRISDRGRSRSWRPI